MCRQGEANNTSFVNLCMIGKSVILIKAHIHVCLII